MITATLMWAGGRFVLEEPTTTPETVVSGTPPTSVVARCAISARRLHCLSWSRGDAEPAVRALGVAARWSFPDLGASRG